MDAIDPSKADANWVGKLNSGDDAKAYRRALIIILAVIGGLSAAQSAYALVIGNRFLLKDGLDWGYDVLLWALALWAFGRSMRIERYAAVVFALVMVVAGLHTAYDLWDKIAMGRRPELWVAGWSSFTMLAAATLTLSLMWRFRRADNPLVAACWLSTRNVAIVTAGFAVTTFFARTQTSQGYEIALDCLSIGLSFQAAFAIYAQIRREAGPESVRESKTDQRLNDDVEIGSDCQSR